jgi:hypothetical protein
MRNIFRTDETIMTLWLQNTSVISVVSREASCPSLRFPAAVRPRHRLTFSWATTRSASSARLSLPWAVAGQGPTSGM